MNPNQHTDKQLIEAYQAGDKSVIALLVKRWHLKFCQKAYWIVKDADLSKDIAQESWQTIMGNLHTLRKPSSFKGWALRIVYSKSLDVLRLQSQKLNMEQELAHENSGLNEGQEGDNIKLKAALLKAIKCLPEKQQEVINLFYIQEYSLNDISDILKISVGTAKSRLFHAREKLKRTLKE